MDVTDFAEFKIDGLDAALATMRNLPMAMRMKVVKPAVRKAANLVRDSARAAALKIDRSETPLKIADNVNVQFASRHFKRTGEVMFRVGVRGGAKAYGNTKQNRSKGRVGAKYVTGGSTFYWRFVELGTSRVRARPFLRPALERNIGAATDVVISEIDKQLARLLKRGKL